MTPIEDLVGRWVLALDDRAWDTVAGCLDDTVRRDYGTLTGAAPDDIAGPDLVAEWRDAIAGLDAHQHVLGLPVVDVAGEDCSHGDVTAAAHEARVSVHVVATHTLDGDPGSPWVVGGTYRLVVRRRGAGWRIAAITLDTRWQVGDRGVLERAAARLHTGRA
jgi:SnoaL-like domain